MTKKYLINYGGSINIENDKIYEGQIINFVLNTYTGTSNYASLFHLDSNNIFDENDQKLNVEDYKLAVIPGDGILAKIDLSLKIGNRSNKKCNGCTNYLMKKIKKNKVRNTLTIEKAFYPNNYEDNNDSFKICKDLTNEEPFVIKPIRLVGKIKKIDTINKLVDVSISDYYKLTNKC
jgi:hypothetical protein